MRERERELCVVCVNGFFSLPARCGGGVVERS
jgi:hypothetical protein